MRIVAGPKEFSVRRPAVAGMFYPADPGQCRELAGSLLHAADPFVDFRSVPAGAIVPHAGWACSGKIAGESLAALASGASPDLVVIFAAVHTPLPLDHAVLGSYLNWEVPGGTLGVAADAAKKLARRATDFGIDDRFHLHEHAVEVELPLIHTLWPKALILPVEIPLIEAAADIGRRTAEQVFRSFARPVFLASSDLTHYGPAYNFAPAGIGLQGLAWAKENDRRLLSLVIELAADKVVPEVRAHANACGGGAIAAMLAACAEGGATRARVLRHHNSYETLADRHGNEPADAVGYAAVVVG